MFSPSAEFKSIKPMRVLHIYKTYYPDTFGGVEQVIHQLALGARAHDIDSDILTVSPRAQPVELLLPEGRVICGQCSFEAASTPFSLATARLFAKLHRQYDLLHYHFPWPFADLMHLGMRCKTPAILSYHADVVAQRKLNLVYAPVRELFLKKMRLIVAASPQYAASSPVLARYQERLRIIPYGLDATPAVDPARIQHWRERLGEGFILFVGVLRYYKGLHTLIAAAQGAPYPIVIAGDGPVAASLRAQAEALGCRNVHFLGRIDEADKAALLHLCRAFVFPSHLRSEAFGISLLEAARQAKPMISCEIATGTTYVNQHEQTGLVIPPEHPQALRAAMNRLFADAELAAKLGAQARQRFDEHFTAQGMVIAYAAAYRAALV